MSCRFKISLYICCILKHKNMNTITQITALCASGAELIWNESINDFVGYEQEVPATDESELPYAKVKAEEYPGIISVNISTITFA